jgi:hypothetical protein
MLVDSPKIMIPNTISSLLVISQIALTQVGNVLPQNQVQPQIVLGERSMSLDHRQVNKPLNDIYKDNILLNMAYMRGVVTKGSQVDWDLVRKPFDYQVDLQPGQTFAFHDLVRAEYAGKVAFTTNSHFGGEEGYKFDGTMYGMGVCHLASVINWAAKDAGLNPVAPTNHDFYAINEIPKEHGVAIYADPNAVGVSQLQNLYITNNKEKTVTFRFNFDGDNLKVTVLQ